MSCQAAHLSTVAHPTPLGTSKEILDYIFLFLRTSLSQKYFEGYNREASLKTSIFDDNSTFCLNIHCICKIVKSPFGSESKIGIIRASLCKPLFVFCRLYRAYYEARSSISEMWQGNPALTAVLFGLPIGFLSLICYSICCADIMDAEDEEEEETGKTIGVVMHMCAHY